MRGNEIWPRDPCPRFRTDLSGRVGSRPRGVSPDHGPPGSGIADDGTGHGSAGGGGWPPWQWQRHNNLACLGLYSSLSLLLLFLGCGRLKPDPPRLYDQAESSYQAGRLDEADLRAGAAYRQLLSAYPQLAGKFQILHVQIMLDRGLNEEALTQLNNSPPQIFATCELAARRYMLEATTYFRIGRYPESESSLQKAAGLCGEAGPGLAADLATRRGVILDDPVTAEKDYRV